MTLMILGGGVAGISAAYHATLANQPYRLFEKRASLGGLLDNFTVNGFRFDHAVHLSFTQDAYVRSIFDQTPYFEHLPDAFCFEQSRWLKHPVQNNLYPLPVEDKVRLLRGVIERPEHGTLNNYREWLQHQYGYPISERYPERYTRKYWTCEAQQLSLSWIGNRMRRADIDEILFGAMSAQTPNDYYAKQMRYPKQGGYKAFLQPMLDKISAQCNKAAVEIDLTQQWVQFSDGSREYYAHLLNSLPLPLFIQLCRDVPTSIKEAAAALWATQVHLVSVGFNQPDLVKDLWFYLYDESMLAARAYSPSVKSPDNVPEGCSSLQFECYFSAKKPMNYSSEQLCENIQTSLAQMNIATPEQILFMQHDVVPYANVVFDIGMEVRRDAVLAYLKGHNVTGIGRFGEWDYFWSDQSLLSGQRGVANILQKVK